MTWTRKDDIEWRDRGEGCIECNQALLPAVLLTLFAMLLNARAMWRYVRHGEMP